MTRVCELEPDLALLAQGLDTWVGEGGLSISGGQRARLALARACYSDADIYLLDDPLSAVDSRVAHKIMRNCLRGYLREKSIIMVTHQLALLSEATNVLALDSSGHAAFYGATEDF